MRNTLENSAGQRVDQGNRVRLLTPLIGEVYNNGYNNEGNDPKQNTEDQRAWMYCKDPALESVKKIEKENRLPFDNATSLPLASKNHFRR